MVAQFAKTTKFYRLLKMLAVANAVDTLAGEMWL